MLYYLYAVKYSDSKGNTISSFTYILSQDEEKIRKIVREIFFFVTRGLSSASEVEIGYVV